MISSKHSIYALLALISLYFGLPPHLGDSTRAPSFDRSETSRMPAATGPAPSRRPGLITPNKRPATQHKVDSNHRTQDRAGKIQSALHEVISDPAISLLLKDRRHALLPFQLVTSDVIETVKFQHYYHGIEVVGSMALHHRGPAGVTIQNQLIDTSGVDVMPSLSPEQALAGAQLQQAVVSKEEFKQPQLKILSPRNGDREPRLVYWFRPKTTTPDAREVIVDAHSGELIATIPIARPY